MKPRRLFQKKKHNKDDPLTPEDLVHAVFHGNKDAVVNALLRRSAPKKVSSPRIFKRGSTGAVVLEDTEKKAKGRKTKATTKKTK